MGKKVTVPPGKWNTDYKPKLKPGSKLAIANGCTCPVVDNHYGKGVPNGDAPNLYWYSSKCPLHKPEVEKL